MADLMVLLIIAAVVGGAITYIVKAKKAGVRCIGCSAGGMCQGNCQDEEASDTKITGNTLVMKYRQDYGH